MNFQTSPAAERNKEPILAVLRDLLPAGGLVLEIASGTGQHVIHFATALPELIWQPTDPSEESLAAMAERLTAGPLANILEPLRLDVHEDPWPAVGVGAVLCINMIHIAPWSAAAALLRGSSRVLDPGAPLILYGPFKRGGAHTAASNAAFDRSLCARNPDWGIRDLDRVTELALQHGMNLDRIEEMPANNLIVVYRTV